jgi:hypothetical protein
VGTAGGSGLRLEAVEVAAPPPDWPARYGPVQWRWVLTDEATNAPVAEHQVRLDPSAWQFEAFVTDLAGYLAWQVAPDRREQDEARMVAQLGEWIGDQVLGPVSGALLARHPVAVRVVVPPAAEALLSRPLQLGHAGGRPLAVQGVTLVMTPLAKAPLGSAGAGEVPAKAPVGERLRVLGLFSLPEGGQALNLRRERHELVELIHRIDAAGKAADVRALQYGVTRESLRGVLEEAEGWDVIHISGHGAPGELLLETADGRPDKVSAAELAAMLDAARRRLKLVMVSACWSAASTVAEQRRRLGLPTREDAAADAPPEAESAAAPLATTLATELGCAVLAMRYPVDDEFAIALSGRLYGLLADKGQPLPEALGLALRQLAAGPAGPGASGPGPGGSAPAASAAAGRAFPALSVATPALFSETALGLSLGAPKRASTPSLAADGDDAKLAGFPPQPERFVGRTRVMARASAALADRSGTPALLLHGMPGGGKTACALELCYGHQHAFPLLAWYKAPDEGSAVDGALTDFAFTLERYLPGFQMIDVINNPARLAAFLPRLAKVAELNRLLIVIDNAESLLSDSGQWRDERWGRVIGALCGHKGLGRLIITSRRVPADWAGMPALSVDALSADETLLLARELPHLKALIYDEVPGLDADVARRLALGVLTVAQGHPKLLELADGQAAHPERLAALVAAGDQAWREQGGLPDGFFATADATAPSGETAASPQGAGLTEEITATADDYWHVLAAWTRAVTATLTAGQRDLFWFLCCLEEPDRERPILDAIWPHLWNQLGRDGQPAGLNEMLVAISARGLAAVQSETSDAESYAIHPGVAAAGRDQAGPPFRAAVDAEAAAYWHAVHRYASGDNDERSVDTGWLVRAGLAGAGYYLRQQDWTAAAFLLESAFVRDPSRANAAAVLPAIQQITRHDPRQAIVLASVLQVIDPAAGEATLRAALANAVARGDYRAASVAAGQLADLCLDSGRLAEALHLAGQKADHTRQAGLGPWTQLADEVRRLQVLAAMGRAGQVLDEIGELRARMDALPATPAADDPAETITPWSVREALVGTGRNAARLLGRWEEALELNAALLASMGDRQAPAADIARSRFNDYEPLLRLGRTGEALALLLEVRQVFQDAHDTAMLGKIFGALADTEDQRGHGDAALRLQRDALRYTCLAGDVTAIAVSYHNLGNLLHRYARQPAPALASHLAAALIFTLIKGGHTDQAIDAAVTDLRELGTAAVPPRDVADLSQMIADIPGTDLPRLIAALSPDPETAEQALRDLIAQAQQLAATPEEGDASPW